MPIDEFEEVKSGFLWLLGLGSPLLLLLATLGGYWLSGRALRPVDEISAAAARIGAQELSARLPARGVGDELDRLSDVLNDMLRRLEAAFHRIAEFTADASHELRTPVAVIQTTAELMQTRPRTPEEHLRAWRTITGETERTGRLISELLTLARSDAGKADLEFREMDLAETARSAAEEMRVMAEAKELGLIEDITEPCQVRGDPEALRRAICILLDNAIKFSAVGGEIRLVVTKNGRASLEVSDTGPGIDSKEIPLIFERFYRVLRAGL